MLSVYFNIFILVVFVGIADCDPSALSGKLVGRNGLSVQCVVEFKVYRQIFCDVAAIINIIALGVPYLHILAVEGIGFVALDVFHIGKTALIVYGIGIKAVFDPIADDDLFNRSIGSGQYINRFVFAVYAAVGSFVRFRNRLSFFLLVIICGKGRGGNTASHKQTGKGNRKHSL